MATLLRDDEPLAEFFAPLLSTIAVDGNRKRALEVLEWIEDAFPHLDWRIAWNQPMVTDHGTFIMGFSYAKNHMAVAPEGRGIEKFADEFARRGISHGTKMFRLAWKDPIPYDLIEDIIRFNIEDKKNVSTFWRK